MIKNILGFAAISALSLMLGYVLKKNGDQQEEIKMLRHRNKFLEGESVGSMQWNKGALLMGGMDQVSNKG